MHVRQIAPPGNEPVAVASEQPAARTDPRRWEEETPDGRVLRMLPPSPSSAPDLRSPRPKSDDELIAEARRRSGWARRELLQELYVRHYPRVARWCRSLARDPYEAEDLVQEVFMKAHRGIDSFDGRCAFGTWLYVITRRSLLDRRRTERRRPGDHGGEDLAELEAEVSSTSMGTVDPSGRQVLRASLHEAIERVLDATEKKVLYLHYVQGLSLPAVTRILALDNKSGAKAYLVSSVRRLRRALAHGRSSESER